MPKRTQAEQTAYGPMVVVAVEQQFPPRERLVEDPLAAQMLPGPYRAIVRACRWAPLRRWLIRASESKAPGIWAAMCGRKRYIDDQISRALERGAESVVILGAGLDSRGARLASSHAHLPVYELDLPANIATKSKRLQALPDQVPENLALVAVDFASVDLGAALEREGFDGSRPAMFVWEGVTQYLSEAAFRRTMEFLRHAPAGSRLVFTHVLRDFIEGRELYGSAALYEDLVVRRKVWLLGLARDEVGPVLREFNWSELEQFGAAEIAQCHVEPTGRALPVSELERCVTAEKF